MPYSRDALVILVEIQSRLLPLRDFQMRMDSRGWSGQQTTHAVRSLERRGWVIVVSGKIHLTESGHAAATTGEGIVPLKKRALSKNRVTATRMPRGLF